ncbi:MAG: prolipoprotein diacylglyceryl transferase [Lachnospiraceae bacterium]|nr:prolipoprotein diacylglyceryl transferase [Lachnospiraceae bacterium]
MNDYSISFPNLGIYLDYVPKTFQVFGISIALYGIIIGCGFFFALLYAQREAKRTGQNPDDYWDLFGWLMVFSILGARIYYVVFAWDFYKDNPISVFQIRNGGLAIYGGVIAGIITIYVYSKVKKKNFFQMLDTIVPGLLIGQVMGRFGNFTNREAFGEYTDGLFAMRLPINMVRQREITPLMAEHIMEGIDYIQAHPTFLYESMWNFMVLLMILFFRRYQKHSGELLALYFIGYGVGRTWIEGLRTDQLLLPVVGLPVSQILAVILVVLGIFLFVALRCGKLSGNSKKNK